MNEREQWLQSNDDYLRDAIHWVKLRLEKKNRLVNTGKNARTGQDALV